MNCKRGLKSRATALQAHLFARLVAHSPRQQLVKVMSGRRRRPLLRQIFAAMPRMVRREALSEGASEVVEIRIPGRPDGGTDVWQLRFTTDGCEASEGSHAKPRLITTFDPVSFLDFAAGLRSAPELFMQGKLKVEGDLLLGARLPSRFVFPGRARRRRRRLG